MTLHRRNGEPLTPFSRDRYDDRNGGTTPANWNAPIVDVDGIAVAIIQTEQHVWIPYEPLPDRRVEPIAIIEWKRPGESVGFRVSQRLAALAGLDWWLIIGPLPDGRYQLQNVDGETVVCTLAEATAAMELPARMRLRSVK